MPMIVDPSAPHVTPPTPAVSPDGWLSASVDATHAGVVLAVDYTAATPYAGAATVRKVRITRTDPGKAPVAVRSADTAWAIEGVGAAYDHEAPLGVAVVYTATAILADGTSGPTSSVAVTVDEPDPPADVWIKSIDMPGLSALVTVTAWPQLQWASRIDSADIAGSPYAATSQDVYASASSDISIDAEGPEIEALRTLLATPGVRLLQTRGALHRPDQYVLFADPAEAVDTTPDGTRTFTATVREVARPDTAGQPMRMPGWSYDHLATQYATYGAVESTFASYQAVATNGTFG